jgi:hypothetical protein
MVLSERISDFTPDGPHTHGTAFPEKISETCSKSVLNCPHIHESKREAKIHAQKMK